jgi:death-on-curing protein
VNRLSNIVYITIEQAKNTHLKTIEKSGGGNLGVLNLGQLESILTNIQNDDYYPEFADKLTHLFFGVCKFHCYADGNKRLAITLSAQFLLLNGYMSIANTFFKEMECISLNVAAGKIDRELLLEIMIAILDETYNTDESLKLRILNAIK